MRKLAAIVISILMVVGGVYGSAEGEGLYQIASFDLQGDTLYDTLTTTGSDATDSIAFITTLHSSWSDTLYFALGVLIEESQTMTGAIDITCKFAPDTTDAGWAWSVETALETDTDIGNTHDKQWYYPSLTPIVPAVYNNKYMKIIIENVGSDQNIYLRDIRLTGKVIR